MEKWYAYEKMQVQIEHIYRFSCAGRECAIFFSDKKERKYALRFRFFDFRYAIENAFLGRPANWEATDSDRMTHIYAAEDSGYIKYFEEQCGKTFPVDGIRHLLLFDRIDTGIEILTDSDPVLTEIEE
jgi:hypothetical protein